MEGLIDWVLRDVLTSSLGLPNAKPVNFADNTYIDQCYTEFIRVTDKLLPPEVFYKYCPELKNGSRTRSGVPVVIQLLGGQPEPLADNASRAIELGSPGVDFNFGCPAKTVNRHDGGASLLKTPERIYKILDRVRRQIPAHIPVTAKMRLGYDSPENCVAVAQAVEAAGVQTLTVHCRTKTDMYKPPAYWEWINPIKQKTKLNIIANGEIWTVEDYEKCRSQTDCTEFMIGRGAISDPFLFYKIKHYAATKAKEDERDSQHNQYIHLLKIMPDFYESCVNYRHASYAVARTKQWFAQLSKRHKGFSEKFNDLKIINRPEVFQAHLKQICD